MKTFLGAVLVVVFSVSVGAQERSKITKADGNDYLDCAAFYTALTTSLTTMNADQKAINATTERIKFYVNTAMIYNGSKTLTDDMKNYYIASNKSQTSDAYKFLKSGDRDGYAKFVNVREAECKDMLNINMEFLAKQQGINLK